MGIDALLARLESQAVSPVTPRNSAGVTRKAAPVLDCTPVTPVTPQSDVTATARVSRWLLHLPDGLLEVTFAPAVRHAEVLRQYPLAVAAEPLPDPAPVWMPADLRALLLRLDLDDRAMAREMYAIDPEGTRLLIEGMASDDERR